MLVHVSDERRDLAPRKLMHTIAEQQLVILERGQGPAGRRDGWIGPAVPRLVVRRAGASGRTVAPFVK
jgi:hypothetical protein